MSQANVRHVQRIIDELFNTSDHHRAGEFYAADCVFHDPAYPPTVGAAALAQMLSAQRAAMPDQKYVLDEVFSDGADRVVIRWRASGTHRGDLMGFAPTGKKLEVSGMSILRIEGGLVREVWQHWDTAGFVRQVTSA